jgi:hypothetical protein
MEAKGYVHLCPGCGKTFTGRRNKKFCTDRCGQRHWEKQHPARSRNTDGEKIITLQMVRKEDKLDKPHPPKVHNAYCLCPKCRDARQQARLEAARQVIAMAYQTAAASD